VDKGPLRVGSYPGSPDCEAFLVLPAQERIQESVVEMQYPIRRKDAKP
jgi:hypothetical protein